MPHIKRWFRVSHDINSDEEMWEFRDRFGKRADAVWLEILSIADRNEGRFAHTTEGALRVLPAKCHTTGAKVEKMLEWLRDKGWISRADPLVVVNHAAYHQQPKAPPAETGKRPPPKAPATQASPAKPKVEERKSGLPPEIIEVADRIYARDPVRFSRLVVWIKQAMTKPDNPPAVIVATLDAFDREDRQEAKEPWWPYLKRIREKIRTEKLQGASAEHKRGDLTKAGAVLRKLQGG